MFLGAKPASTTSIKVKESVSQRTKTILQNHDEFIATM
jgi:hypothetical protein